MSASPRLFVASGLAPGAEFDLPEAASHYVARVMRRSVGDELRLFNGREGEVRAGILSVGRGLVRVEVRELLRLQRPGLDLWLLFAPLKKDKTDLVVEKAVELGVSRIQPVITERCNATAVRLDRWRRIAIEAAEQSERLDIPDLMEPATLDAVLSAWPGDRLLIFCDEAGDDETAPWGGATGRARPAAEVLGERAGQSAACLIGPEGGFSPRERDRLRASDSVAPVSLGPRILRAETASILCLGLWGALAGEGR